MSEIVSTTQSIVPAALDHFKLNFEHDRSWHAAKKQLRAKTIKASH